MKEYKRVAMATMCAVSVFVAVCTHRMYAGDVSVNDLLPYSNAVADGDGGFWNTTSRAALTVFESVSAATESVSTVAATLSRSASGAVEPRALTSEPSTSRMIKTGKPPLCITFR